MWNLDKETKEINHLFYDHDFIGNMTMIDLSWHCKWETLRDIDDVDIDDHHPPVAADKRGKDGGVDSKDLASCRHLPPLSEDHVND